MRHINIRRQNYLIKVFMRFKLYPQLGCEFYWCFYEKKKLIEMEMY